MYAISLSGPTAQTRPPEQLIFGLPADSAVRIGAPLLMGVLSAVGLVYAVRGKQHVATTFALTGLIMSSLVAAGQAIALEEERGRI